MTVETLNAIPLFQLSIRDLEGRIPKRNRTPFATFNYSWGPVPPIELRDEQWQRKQLQTT